MKLLGLSRTSYYRQIHGMKDYTARLRKVELAKHEEILRGVALKLVEAGHRRVTAYATAREKLLPSAARFTIDKSIQKPKVHYRLLEKKREKGERVLL